MNRRGFLGWLGAAFGAAAVGGKAMAEAPKPVQVVPPRRIGYHQVGEVKDGPTTTVTTTSGASARAQYHADVVAQWHSGNAWWFYVGRKD